MSFFLLFDLCMLLSDLCLLLFDLYLLLFDLCLLLFDFLFDLYFFFILFFVPPVAVRGRDSAAVGSELGIGVDILAILICIWLMIIYTTYNSKLL